MPELQFQKRQIAYKVRISDILNGVFAKDDVIAGYIRINNTNVSRANIIGTIVYKAEETNFASAVIDDGTGRISLRSFEKTDIFSKIDVGDMELVIGKIREFNNEKYIILEIIKKLIDINWMNLRKMELKDNFENKIETKKEPVEEIASINDEIYALIKKLDKGNGISVDEVIKNSNNSDAEIIINKLLERGDIFEIKPGKLKVLE